MIVFWKKEGKRITWIKPYTKIKNVNIVKMKFILNGMKMEL